MIVYTNLIFKGFDAVTVWPFIFIRPSRKGDEALLIHEQVHYEDQKWITPYWLLRYWLSKSFRLRVEVLGYKAQIAAGGVTIEQAANMLMSYKLDITYERALEELR